MATGALGGAAFVGIIGIAVLNAIALMRRRPQMAWLPIVFFQYLIHMQVAGCLYFNPTGFALIGIMLAIRPRALAGSEAGHVRPRRQWAPIRLTEQST